jgi:hypothetical protein
LTEWRDYTGVIPHRHPARRRRRASTRNEPEALSGPSARFRSIQ